MAERKRQWRVWVWADFGRHLLEADQVFVYRKRDRSRLLVRATLTLSPPQPKRKAAKKVKR